MLDVLALRAHAELDAIAPQSGPQDLHVGALRYRLSTLGDKETHDYIASLTVRSAVSSVFANAKASAALQPWKQVEYKAGFTYVCVHCGAPQQAPLNFVCRYCNQHVSERA